MSSQVAGRHWIYEIQNEIAFLRIIDVIGSVDFIFIYTIINMLLSQSDKII